MSSLLFILVNESRCCEKFYSRINDAKVYVLIYWLVFLSFSCYFLVPIKHRYVHIRFHIGWFVSVYLFCHILSDENTYTCQIGTIKTNV